MRLTALVLAAGASRRAGGVNKLLARDRSGQAMILRTIDAALRSTASDVILVLGHERAPIAECLKAAGLPEAAPRLRLVRAQDHAEGIAASLRCGIAAAAGNGSDGALICLGDMPLVRPETLDLLMQALRSDPHALACVPVANGEAGNPVLWHGRLFGALLGLSGDHGGRSLLERNTAFVRRVPVADGGILEDFDTPDRLAAFALR